MSILIKGMEMPDGCVVCPFFIENRHDRGDDSLCRASRKEVKCGCPLIPVPPHGDLIDRKPFVEFIQTHWDSYDQWFVEQLEARPTIIPTEEGE